MKYHKIDEVELITQTRVSAVETLYDTSSPIQNQIFCNWYRQNRTADIVYDTTSTLIHELSWQDLYIESRVS